MITETATSRRSYVPVRIVGTESMMCTSRRGSSRLRAILTRGLHHSSGRRPRTCCTAANCRGGLEGHFHLSAIADHYIEVEPERGQYGLGYRFDLLGHVVLAIERMLDIVKWLRARGGHDVLD
jgi:hypothetical protein